MLAGRQAIMMGMDGVACFHSDPPVADEVLEDDLETVGMVVCAHAFGVGVHLADEGAWGHVNTPALIPGADGKVVLPRIGAYLSLRVLGYSGTGQLHLAQRALSDATDTRPTGDVPPNGYVLPRVAWCVEYVDPRQPGEGSFQVSAFTTEAAADALLKRMEAEGFFAPLHINMISIHRRVEDWEWDR